MNGGPGVPFTNAVWLVVNCDSQEEIDYFLEKLGASRTGIADGGEQIQCGWLKYKFGHAVADPPEPDLGLAER